MKTLTRFSPLWLGVLAALLYAPTLQHGFVNYDDPWLLQRNVTLHSLTPHHLHTIWLDLSPSTRVTLGREYLPVRDTSAMLDFAIYGHWTTGHHLTNILLYGLFCGFLVLALMWWLPHPGVAITAGLLFVVHPYHVEAVAWLSERKGLLAGLFVALSMLAFYRFSRRGPWPWLLLATACMILGIWSKAIATMGVPFLAALLWLYPPEDARSGPTEPAEPPPDEPDHQAQPPKAPTAQAATEPPGPASSQAASRTNQLLASLPLRAWVGWIGLSCGCVLAFVPFWWTGKQMQMLVEDGGASLWTMAHVHGMYLQRLLLLGPFGIKYPLAESQLWWPMGVVGAASAALILGVAFVGAWRRGPWRLWALAAWCWILFLLPVSQLLVNVQNIMADRYMLMPSLGGALAFAGLLYALLRQPMARRLTVAIIVVIAGTWTLSQQQSWSSSAALYKQALRVDPDNVDAAAQLIQFDRKAGARRQAWKRLRTLHKRHPHHPKLALQRSLLLLQEGKVQAAIDALRDGAKYSKDAKLRANLALLLLRTRKPKEALRWAREAVSLRPQVPHTQRTLGVIAMQQGLHKEALRAFKRALLYEPHKAQNHINLAAVYQRLGRSDRLHHHLQRARALRRRR